VQKADKEKLVQDLTERLRSADSLIVADYRGLTNAQLAALRSELLKHGARLTVVKNTLTRRAAQEAGSEALLAMLEGPTAIAFVEAEGDPVAVAKALSDAAKETKILALRGGILSGRSISDADVESLAKLPPLDVLQAQLVGVIVAPLTQLVAVLNAPLQNLVGLIDARIAQLGDSAVPDTSPVSEQPAEQPAEQPGEPTADEPAAEAEVAAAQAEVEEAAAADAPEPASENTENTDPESD
jgi:large subunit ribosomal protein L10